MLRTLHVDAGVQELEEAGEVNVGVPHDQVGLGDHPRNFPHGIHHRHTADAVVHHQPGNGADPGLRADEQRVAGHNLADLHGDPPFGTSVIPSVSCATLDSNTLRDPEEWALRAVSYTHLTLPTNREV